MTPSAEQYPFLERDLGTGTVSLAPLLPISLTGLRSVSVSGFLDTGAAINVLPYSIGEQLGLEWEQHTTSVELTGTLAACEARVLVVSAVVGRFAPLRLAFAWAKTDAVPVLLGQVNFFLEFDVCFFRARRLFEVRPKQDA